MATITLAQAKAQCRVTTSSEDNILAIYIDAAEELAAKYCNRRFAVLPSAVMLGALLMIDSAYNDRENPAAMAVLPDTPVAALLNTEKDWAHMPSGPAPAGASFDTEIMTIGDEWSRQWAYKNEDGTPIDVTGYTGTFELLSGESVVHSGALTVVSAIGGTFSYSLPDLTGVIVPGEYWYKARIVPAVGLGLTIDRKIVIAQ